jgi:hypothetical protein
MRREAGHDIKQQMFGWPSNTLRASSEKTFIYQTLEKQDRPRSNRGLEPMWGAERISTLFGIFPFPIAEERRVRGFYVVNLLVVPWGSCLVVIVSHGFAEA